MIILFSLCGGPDMPRGATIFLRENPNLFNVAVSRARAVLHIVGNREWALNCGVSFIEKLAERTLPESKRPTQREPYQSPREKVLPKRCAKLASALHHSIPSRAASTVHRTAGGGRQRPRHHKNKGG